MQIKWGIIGCGDVTEVKSGPAFNKVPDSRLVAVMRRNAARAKDYAQRHQVPKWYDRAEDLINDAEINAIYIATPPVYHEAYALQCIAAGKSVYLEKPMTMDAAGARRIAEQAKEKKVKISVAHYRRQQPQFLKIRELIAAGAIGDVRLATLRFFQPHQSSLVAHTEDPWRLVPAISGGGLFHDLAPHQLDLMYYFFGRAKQAQGISLNTSGLYAADDTVTGSAAFENNVLFNGAWCFTAAEEEKRDECLIIGADGTIGFSVFQSRDVVITCKGKTEILSFDALEHVQQPMIEKVVAYFLGRSENPCSAEDGVRVMQLIDAFTKNTERK